MNERRVQEADEDQSKMQERVPDDLIPLAAWRECPYIEKDIYHCKAWLRVTGAIEFKAQHTTQHAYSGNNSRVFLSVFDEAIFHAQADSGEQQRAWATVTLKVNHPGVLNVRCSGLNHLADALDTRMWYRLPVIP